MNYKQILADATRAAPLHKYSSGQGCCRVYVCIADKAHRRGIKSAAAKLGLKYQTEAAYGFRHVLYIGYDNNSGIEMNRAEGIAEALKTSGISAFAEFGGD